MLWEDYERYLRVNGRAESTIRSSKHRLFHMFDFLSARGWHSLEGLPASEIAEFFLYLRTAPANLRNPHSKVKGHPIAPTTVLGYYRVISALMNYLVAQGYIKKSLLAGVKRPGAKPTLIETYTDDEIRAGLKWISKRKSSMNQRDIALILLMYQSGLRLTEARTLKRSDLNLEDHIVKVLGKGNKRRIVPLRKRTYDALKSWLLVAPKDAKYLFPSRYGRPMAKSTIWQMWKEVCIGAGIPLRKELIHSLRHTAACNLLKDTNGDVMLVKTVLGHSAIQTTMRYVEHMEVQRSLNRVRKLDP